MTYMNDYGKILTPTNNNNWPTFNVNTWTLPVYGKIPVNIAKAGSKNTHVVFVLDESGSMEEKKKLTIKSFNKFLKSQKKEGKEIKEDTFISLFKFNGFCVTKVYSKLNIKEVEMLSEENYHPHGGTNLLDSIGDAIVEANYTLLGSEQDEREKIIFVILTDGEENCSIRHNNVAIKNLISHCEEQKWSFIYLGVGVDAFGQSSTYGFTNMNSLHVNDKNVDVGIISASSMTSRLRSYTGPDSMKYEGTKFTEEEIKKSKGE